MRNAVSNREVRDARLDACATKGGAKTVAAAMKFLADT